MIMSGTADVRARARETRACGTGLLATRRGCHTRMMAIHWNRLLESLNSWANARVVTDGIEVTFTRPSGGQRTVELVLAPDEWDSLVSHVRRDTPRSVRERILVLPEDQPFLVCDRGVDLVASATRELPPAGEGSGVIGSPRHTDGRVRSPTIDT